jgi:phage gp46-like protein|tara:strand:+ start:80430 stop:80831 length:402 start_codon:yes stop_codon:yes gene_type:complete
MSIRELLASADQIERAVVISLFTWRRAEDSDPVDDDERYGYWGDAYPDVARDRIGSRLWLLRRRSLTAETIQNAERYAREALAWMLEDEVVSAVQVDLVRPNPTRLDLYVTLTLDEGQRELRFDDVLGVINAV